MRICIWHHAPMKRAVVLIVILAAVALGYVVARNRPTADQQAVQFRQALMTVIAGVCDPLFLMQRGQLAYDGAVVQRRAGQLAMLSAMIGEAFAHDTRAATRLQTAALPYVWSSPAAFSADVAKLQRDATSLQAAVQQETTQTEDAARVRTAIQSIDADCAQCHRQYRAN